MDDLTEFKQSLKQAFLQGLPGVQAHDMLTPGGGRISAAKVKNENWVRHSGVLVLFYPKEDSVYTVLMERPEYPGAHSGQIGFPGGKVEKHDKDIIETALREGNEEVGIIGSDIEIIGQLTEVYIPVSRFVVTPVVGFSSLTPNFKRNPSEVERIIELDVRQLFSADSLSREVVTVAGKFEWEVPCFNFNGDIVWGATSMMINELRLMLGNSLL